MCHAANEWKTKNLMKSYEKPYSLGENINILVYLSKNHCSDDSLYRTAILYVNTPMSFMYQGICVLFLFPF